MTKQIDPLSLISIPSPCSVGWDSMTGNDRIRFCSQCNLHVHNLSEMTPRAAIKLIANSQGRLCARYTKRPESAAQPTTMTPLYQIGRRASRIAAGVFSATLGLSAAVATAQARTKSNPLIFTGVESASSREAGRKASPDGSTASIEGHVVYPNDEVAPGARVILTNERTQLARVATSGKRGEFSFQSLEAGTYILKVEAPNSAPPVIKRIDLLENAKERVIAKLEFPELAGDVSIAVPENPLVRAAMSDDLKELKKLLEAGAKVDAVDSIFNMTALAMAVGHGNLEMVELLLWHGADVNVKSSGGDTALMNLSLRTTPEVVRALITAGAKVNLQDRFGETALINIASHDNPDVLQALIDAGAEVNAMSGLGQTALMLAAEKGLVENVKALIAAGANTHVWEDTGSSALNYARKNGHHDVEKVLLEAGAIK